MKSRDRSKAFNSSVYLIGRGSRNKAAPTWNQGPLVPWTTGLFAVAVSFILLGSLLGVEQLIKFHMSYQTTVKYYVWDSMARGQVIRRGEYYVPGRGFVPVSLIGLILAALSVVWSYNRRVRRRWSKIGVVALGINAGLSLVAVLLLGAELFWGQPSDPADTGSTQQQQEKATERP